jgi:hypothetical protein
MYVILCYRLEADPGQHEPRGVDPFAGISVVGSVFFRELDARRQMTRWESMNPSAAFMLHDAGLNPVPQVLYGS